MKKLATEVKAAFLMLLFTLLVAAHGRPVLSAMWGEQAVDAPLSPFLQEHVAALAVDNKIILTQTSCGYLEFAVNWISHMEALGITNWLTIAEDETALKFLDARYPGHALPASAFTNEALTDGNALFEWGSAAFTKVACARPTYLQMVLSLGYEVLWSDMDAVWLKNFFQLAPQGLDYVGVDDSDAENEMETENACTGLMYFRPTSRARELLSDWHSMCIELNQNNQGAFNRVFSGSDGASGGRRSLDYYIMPKQLYPHGLLLELAEYTRSPEGMRVSGLDPAWVHANYRVGHAAKREFLRDRLVWRAEEAMILSGGAGRGSGGGYPVCPASADGIMPIPEEEFPAPNEGTLPETELQPLRLGEGTPA